VTRVFALSTVTHMWLSFGNTIVFPKEGQMRFAGQVSRPLSLQYSGQPTAGIGSFLDLGGFLRKLVLSVIWPSFGTTTVCHFLLGGRASSIDGTIGLYVGASCIRGGGAQEGKKATCEQKIVAFKLGIELTGGRRLDDMGLSVPLRLLRQAITWLADDWTPKVQVGRVELGQFEGALRATEGSLERVIQLWAWWTLAYGGLLRSWEVAELQWGRIVPVQVKLAVLGLKVFKTHTQAVPLWFAPREVGLCVVKALADWDASVQL
jgi:hypothetical protein